MKIGFLSFSENFCVKSMEIVFCTERHKNPDSLLLVLIQPVWVTGGGVDGKKIREQKHLSRWSERQYRMNSKEMEREIEITCREIEIKREREKVSAREVKIPPSPTNGTKEINKWDWHQFKKVLSFLTVHNATFNMLLEYLEEASANTFCCWNDYRFCRSWSNFRRLCCGLAMTWGHGKQQKVLQEN